ncbi:gluconate 2-dehydrogenase subunit 3 family protein [Barrientosiimonas marina]|uniref:Gluconate 2-dehydrogenase subunit 3 family protein n=1 Tax=Lentibacillus kimchii TaxID=1542911 RepID=A0ABW2UW50_9BACI
MADNDDNAKDKKPDLGRRRFMKNTGIAVGGVAGGSLLGGLLTDQFQSNETTDTKTEESGDKYTEARMFFTRFEDFVVLEQATERLFPKNDDGPGAIELGVPYFFDKQLAGTWGINGRDYRHGPFLTGGTSVQHSSLNRGEVIRSGIRKMNQLSQERFDTSFDKAEEDQQMAILKDFESGDVKMGGVNASSFFGLLRDMTLEGAYSDPLYGGNRHMSGWKMKDFPGAVMSYSDIIEDDEFVKKDPVSLTDYQQKS